jgi:CBS domain-containing protein
MKTAAELMTPDPACRAADAPLGAVARSMMQHNYGEVPVMDTDGQLIGVVSDRDIVCRVLAAGKNPLDHTVQDCMSQPVITVQPDTTVTDVMTTMERHQIRRVPVVDTSDASGSSRTRIWRGPRRRRTWRCCYANCHATRICRRGKSRCSLAGNVLPGGRAGTWRSGLADGAWGHYL